MPYKIKKVKTGFKVCKPSGKCFSKTPMTKERALKQQRALYANESFFVQIINDVLKER